ncbi:protein-glutamine gamma-glutamyltransferase E-like [Gastrophryne carolinensis]
MAEMVIQTCVSPCIDNELSGELKVVSEQAIGKDVVFNLLIKNLTTESKEVTADIKASSIIYTRKEINEILRETRKIDLEGCEVKEEAISIAYSQYNGLLTPDNAIEVTVVCSSEPIKGNLIIQTNAVLANPKFDIKLKGPACLNQPVTAEIKFTNPLNLEVSDIVATAEGSGLLRDPVTIKEKNSVMPNETITMSLTMTPYKAGERYLLVDLTTSMFQNAKGSLKINVSGQEEEEERESDRCKIAFPPLSHHNSILQALLFPQKAACMTLELPQYEWAHGREALEAEEKDEEEIPLSFSGWSKETVWDCHCIRVTKEQTDNLEVYLVGTPGIDEVISAERPEESRSGEMAATIQWEGKTGSLTSSGQGSDSSKLLDNASAFKFP